MTRLGLLPLLTALISCSTTDNAAPEIDAVLSAQVAAWNEGDIEGYMEGYWKSDSLRFASDGDVTYGWRPTLERYRKRYANRALMGSLLFSEMDIRVLSPASAIVFGRWTLRRESDEPTGYFTLAMKRFPEGWRIVHDHTSSKK